MCWNFHLKLPSQSRRNEYFNFPPDDQFDCLEILFLKIFRNIVDVVRWMCCIFDELMGPCRRNFFCRFWLSVDRQQLRKNSLQSEKTLTSMRPFKKLFSLNYVKSIWIWSGERHLRTHVINSTTIDRRKKIENQVGLKWNKLLAAEWKAQGNQWAGKGKLDNSTEADCRAAEVGQVQIRICITRTAYTTLFQWNIHSFGAGSDLIFHQIQLFHWISFQVQGQLLDELISILDFFKKWTPMIYSFRTNIGRNADHSEADAAGGVSSGHLHSSASHGNGTNTSSELSNIRL